MSEGRAREANAAKFWEDRYRTDHKVRHKLEDDLADARAVIEQLRAALEAQPCAKPSAWHMLCADDDELPRGQWCARCDALAVGVVDGPPQPGTDTAGERP